MGKGQEWLEVLPFHNKIRGSEPFGGSFPLISVRYGDGGFVRGDGAARCPDFLHLGGCPVRGLWWRKAAQGTGNFWNGKFPLHSCRFFGIIIEKNGNDFY